ncbi:TetR/AcrR family transcriptional regulator [Planosporangium sp. 12N6]|uniref:TetR/AcrR family transcriptional regulator n=1 Tax=Planosporangium spinosum TaxID=3402278 RepID=UPI003CEB5840
MALDSVAGAAAAGPVQTRLLAAAVSLFAEKGFDATSVQEVVERADVTKGAMYHYFRSKDDLLYEIYHGLISQQLTDLDRILAAGGEPGDVIRAIIVDLVETTAARLAEAAVFSREMHRLSADRRAALRAQRRRYHEAFRDLVARGQADGVFAAVASADTVTLIVFGVVNQLPQWYQPDGPKSPRQLADEVADFVLAGLAVPPAS